MSARRRLSKVPVFRNAMSNGSEVEGSSAAAKRRASLDLGSPTQKPTCSSSTRRPRRLHHAKCKLLKVQGLAHSRLLSQAQHQSQDTINTSSTIFFFFGIPNCLEGLQKFAMTSVGQGKRFKPICVFRLPHRGTKI